MIILAIASTLAIGLGLLRMPFGYYTLLRVVLCLTSALGFAGARSRGDNRWVWIYAVLAIVYNPILPVKLGSKSLWVGVNLLTLIFVWIGAFRLRGVISEEHSAKGVSDGRAP